MANKVTIITLINLVAFLIIPVAVFAEEPPLGSSILGNVEGIGTYFEITDSEYLNISLQSTEEITVSLESVPKTISLNIKGSASIDSTTITITGFEPNASYYKYTDSYRNEEIITADTEGKYAFSQEIISSHHIWFQESSSTVFLPEDCSDYGIWDEPSSTCTLTQDLTESVEITENNITLDCDGHSITGAGTGYGVYLNKSGVAIRNCIIVNFSYGAYLPPYSGLSNNNIIDNVFEDNDRGIFLGYTANNNSLINNTCQNNNIGMFLAGGNNVVTNNTCANNNRGFLLYYSDGNNIFTGNAMTGNEYNFNVQGFDLYQYVQDIDTSNTVDGKPIYYWVNKQNKQVPSDAGYVAIVDSTNITVNNLTLINNSEGILLAYSNNSSVENVNVVGNYYGIRLHRSADNTIIGNNIENNYHGVFLYYASDGIPSTINNFVTNNDVSNNERGITIWQYAKDNTIAENHISGNEFGIYIDSFAGANYVYLNDFIDNTDNAYCRSSKVIWNSPEEIPYTYNGTIYRNYLGNYWSDYIGIDANNNGIGDTPYYIATVGQDNYPLMQSFEYYIELPLPTKAANLAKELVNHPEAYLWGGKGWDYNLAEFVASANVLSGYIYWNPTLLGLDTGKGVDCSGLITWAFNRAFDAFRPATDNFVKYVNANGLHSDFQSGTVAEADLLPGDAMFFDWGTFDEVTQTWNGIKDGYIDHTAMYVGESGGYDVVNATSPRQGIIAAQKNLLARLTGFEDFRRIHEADVEMEITAGSPIDLIVTDPDGLTITSDSIIPSDEEYIREIPGVLYYLEMERGADGNPIDRVYSPVLKTGDYLISVVPEPDALATDSFSLSFTAGATTTMLAENIPISDIPSQSYIVRTSEEGFEKIIPAKIKIKPETLNLSSKGVLTVFLQIEPGFGASVNDIATSTILLAGAQPIKTFIEMEDIIYSSEAEEDDRGHKDDNHRHGHKDNDNDDEDEEDDKVLTLIAKFRVRDLIDIPTGKNVPLLLTAQLLDGTKVEGSDTVRVIRKHEHEND